MTGAPQADGLGSAKAPEPSGLRPSDAIPSAAEIAGSLTKAQRAAVLTNNRGFAEHAKGKWFSATAPTARILHAYGLIETPENLSAPTALGVAVRQHLEDALLVRRSALCPLGALEEIAYASWPSVRGDSPVDRIQAFARDALEAALAKARGEQ